MGKLLTIIFGILFAIVLSTSVKSVLASERAELDIVKDEQVAPSCTSQTYEVDADEDNDTYFDVSETGGKVEITFNDLDGTPPSEDDRDQVIVTAGAGYEIVNVQYELEHYSGIGWITVPGNNPTTTITLAGTDDDSRIDEVEVKLKKACPSTTPTTTPSTTITPTPTEAPRGGSSGGDGLSDGRSDGRSDGGSTTINDPYKGVLGATTMAKTGSFTQNMMNLLGVFGLLLTAAGYKSYRKDLSA